MMEQSNKYMYRYEGLTLENTPHGRGTFSLGLLGTGGLEYNGSSDML